MATEFPGRFQKLFAGPMWSGLDQSDVKNPLKVSMANNVISYISAKV